MYLAFIYGLKRSVVVSSPVRHQGRFRANMKMRFQDFHFAILLSYTYLSFCDFVLLLLVFGVANHSVFGSFERKCIWSQLLKCGRVGLRIH